MRPVVAATASQTRGTRRNVPSEKKLTFQSVTPTPRSSVGFPSRPVSLRCGKIPRRSRLGEAASERQTSSRPSPPDLESLDESLPTRTSHPMTILSPSMNLYSGTSRLYGAGPLRMRPDAS